MISFGEKIQPDTSFGVVKTFQYKLKPTETQQSIFSQWLGTCRYVYNISLEYKAKWYGRIFAKVPPQYTSKDCSTEGCGYRAEAMPLSIREWQCPDCCVVHNRDGNAAKNILIKWWLGESPKT